MPPRSSASSSRPTNRCRAQARRGWTSCSSRAATCWSGAGKAGMDELFEQSRNIFVGDSAEPKKFTKQIAFNVIPHIDSFLDDGSTKEAVDVGDRTSTA